MFEEKINLTESEELLLRCELAKRKLDLYRPYPKQIVFHNASAKYREILLMAANQCVAPWTFIETAESTVPSAEAFFVKGANVLSWDGGSECVSQISGGFLKGIEPAFRLVMESGHFFDCTSSHQILTAHGYCSIDQIMSQLNGLYLLQRDECLTANYVACGYLDGQQLRSEEGSGQGQLPSSDDVRRHSLIFSPEDAEEHRRRYTSILREYGHLSTFESVPLPLRNLFDLFSAAKVKSDVLGLTFLHENILRLVATASSLVRSCDESLFHDAAKIFRVGGWPESFEVEAMIAGSTWLSRSSLQFPNAQNQGCSVQLLNHGSAHKLIFYPFKSPLLIGGGKIVSIVPLGYQPIIDCNVPGVNNYKAAGVYHHNCGKTYAAAAQTAMHAIGVYAPWYEGKKFRKAPVIWCAGVTGEVVRDSIQRLLLGDVANPGTGLIPQSSIIDIFPSRGVANLVDTILVRHISGQNTRIRLKYYEQGREKFQADTVDYVHLDEEPDEEIYLEALTRTNATGGYVVMTFTPLKGMSTIVRRFKNESSPDRTSINMTIDDAIHIPVPDRQKIIDSYPAHERDARTRGIPMLGSGAIFPIADEDIMCDAFSMDNVPFYWQEIGGLDFGWDHPTAAVKLLYDTQGDIIYVTNTYRRREATPLQHAAALKPWGKLLFAWPHDGLQHDKGSGVPLKEIYREQGLEMRSENARFEDGSNGVEAGLTEMLIRMETGRFKVFRHLNDFFEEKRMYHRREGKIWKEFDDIISSVRIAMMDLRYAKRVSLPRGSINGNPIEDTIVKDPYNDPNWNPLSHAFINDLLGVKK